MMPTPSTIGTLFNSCVAMRHVLQPFAAIAADPRNKLMHTVQCKTGVRYRPHDLQEVFIGLPIGKYMFEHCCITTVHNGVAA
jgi:hypothetical protein